MGIVEKFREKEAKLRAKAKALGMPNAETANIGAVISFIVMAVIMSIGVVILYNVQSSTPVIPNTSGWYTTQSSLATTTQSGYGLLAITLIVMAAVAIMGTLFVLIRRND